jgi:hypothetical protein
MDARRGGEPDRDGAGRLLDDGDDRGITEAGPAGRSPSWRFLHVVLADLVVILPCMPFAWMTRLALARTAPRCCSCLPAWEIIGSFAFGTIFGSLYRCICATSAGELTLVLVSMCVALTPSGRVAFRPLLRGGGRRRRSECGVARRRRAARLSSAAMPIVGDVLCRRRRIDSSGGPATLGAMAVAISAVRLSLSDGARCSARAPRASTRASRLLWRALMTKAGVALGLAVLAANEYPTWGDRPRRLSSRSSRCTGRRADPVQVGAHAGEEISAPPGLSSSRIAGPGSRNYAEDGRFACGRRRAVSVALDALMRAWGRDRARRRQRRSRRRRRAAEMPPESPAYAFCGESG